MVLHNFGDELYSRLVTTMTFHLRGEVFLEELCQKWADHNEALQMILVIFADMDITFIPSTHKTPIHELGFNLWRDIVIPPTLGFGIHFLSMFIEKGMVKL